MKLPQRLRLAHQQARNKARRAEEAAQAAAAAALAAFIPCKYCHALFPPPLPWGVCEECRTRRRALRPTPGLQRRLPSLQEEVRAWALAHGWEESPATTRAQSTEYIPPLVMETTVGRHRLLFGPRNLKEQVWKPLVRPRYISGVWSNVHSCPWARVRVDGGPEDWEGWVLVREYNVCRRAGSSLQRGS